MRYIQFRAGRDGQKVQRTLFGIDGAMSRIDVYQMIEEAEEGSKYFRIKISPDPGKEDTNRDLSLWEITKQTIESAERKLGKEIAWVAAVHDDHTQIRHLHVLAIAKTRSLVSAPAMIQSATEACRQQRLELDRTWEQNKQQEQERGEIWERELALS